MKLKIGGKYKHFKGGEYLIKCFARDSDTLEDLVVYESLYNSKKFPKGCLWTRPKSDFLGTKEIGGVEVERFKYIRD